MKQNITFFKTRVLFLSLLTVFLFSNCSKSENDPGSEIELDCAEGCMSFSIDGNHFHSDIAVGVISDLFGTQILQFGNFNDISFSEISLISLTIPANQTINEIEYNLGECETGVNVCGALTYTNVDQNNTSESIGYSSQFTELNITFDVAELESGGQLKGSFNGEILNVNDVSDAKVITNGRFNVTIR